MKKYIISFVTSYKDRQILGSVFDTFASFPTREYIEILQEELKEKLEVDSCQVLYITQLGD